MRRISFVLAALMAAMVTLPGCQTLQQIAALKSVDFAIDGVRDVNLAGVQVQNVRSYSDLSILDAAKLTAALSRRELPLRLTVMVGATNPADNPVSARMVGMDWALLLDDRTTVSGTFNDPQDLPPGVPVGIPVSVELNLIEFFDSNARDLFELVQAVAGAGGQPKRVALRARPTIETAIGPIRYPNDITIISREVGG